MFLNVATARLVSYVCRLTVGEESTAKRREIDAAMTGLCRCGTYNRIRQAINSAVQKMSNTSTRKEGGA